MDKKLKELKIVSLSVNSILAIYRRYNLQQFILNHTTDILAVNETKINKKQHLL